MIVKWFIPKQLQVFTKFGVRILSVYLILRVLILKEPWKYAGPSFFKWTKTTIHHFRNNDTPCDASIMMNSTQTSYKIAKHSFRLDTKKNISSIQIVASNAEFKLGSSSSVKEMCVVSLIKYHYQFNSPVKTVAFYVF